MENSLAANEIFIMMLSGIFIIFGLAVAFVFLVNRAQKKLFEEQMKAQGLLLAHQEELLYSTILTQEEERKRIAKDLHDEIGSKLSVINLNLYQLRRPNVTAESIKETVQDLLSVIGNTIDTTRRISHDLLPPTLENFGLKEAVKELCEAYPSEGAPAITFELMQNNPPIVEKSIELNFFRILQELINNSIKHGGAANIGIKLWLTPEGVSLHYKDNGKGFEMDKVEKKSGLGMKNIESRVNMFKGSYEFHSALGKGVAAQIDYRLKPKG